MEKTNALTAVYSDSIPQEKESGKIYISEKYKTAIHLCACGCGIESVTPLTNDGWVLSKHEDNTVTLRPSIGNFNGERPYHAHYFITKGKVEWLKD